MIADAHCHAWRRWPYDPPVPDPGDRGTVEQLLYQMDAHSVGHAAVVCARIGHEKPAPYERSNDDNNDYVAAAAARHPDRLTPIVDVDCVWRPEHHTPGAAQRLRETVERCGAAGFTHYAGPYDGWFSTDDGRELFATAAELDLVASLSLGPAWQADVREVARAHPTLPILLHHLGAAHPRSATFETDLAEVVASAAEPNICVKISGFHYVSDRSWDFPYADAREVARTVAAAFTPARLLWGSDFPAAIPMLTYTQSLEVVRTHCDFLTPADLDGVLGDNLRRVLDTRRPPAHRPSTHQQGGTP